MINVQDYISGFLFKNQYCTFSGLGTLELHKKRAVVSDDGNVLAPPSYHIHFSPVGIIDDAFPTYIGDHENVSIAKASNDIKSFSQMVRAELRKTGQYEVDHLGTFYLQDDVVKFKQSNNLDFGFKPISLVQNEQNNEPEETKSSAQSYKDVEFTHEDSINSKPNTSTLLKYLIGLLLLIGLVAGAYFGYDYYQQNKSDDIINEEPAVFEEEPVIVIDSSAIGDHDSLGQSADSTSGNMENEAAPSAGAGQYSIAVQSFTDKEKADKKSAQLVSYGHKTSVLTRGELHWLVVTASSPTGDTVALKDSLRRFFNPAGTPFVIK